MEILHARFFPMIISPGGQIQLESVKVMRELNYRSLAKYRAKRHYINSKEPVQYSDRNNF